MAGLPNWGQLGCQGFIILDGQGSVVCKTTPAFMEVEDLAFRYVETILGSLLSSRGPARARRARTSAARSRRPSGPRRTMAVRLKPNRLAQYC